MRKRFTLLLTSSILAVSLLAGCAKAPKKEVSQKFQGDQKAAVSTLVKGDTSTPNKAKNRADAKDTLIVGTNEAAGDFNPLYASSVYDQYVVELVFNGLLNNDSAGKLVPGLAKDMPTLSEDQKSYTFTLKDGLTFSDGTPVTAKDVAFTFTTLCDPTYDGRAVDFVGLIQGGQEYKDNKADTVSGIKVVDDKTITLTFKDARYTNIYQLSVGILPEKVYTFAKGKIDAFKKLMATPVGSGAYKFVKFEPKQFVKFEANDKYFLGAPKVKNLIMKFTTVDTYQQELANGTIDVQLAMAPKPENFELIKKAGNLDMWQYPQNGYGYIGFNLRDERFADKAVRQALTYGFNRKQFVDTYYQGYAQVANLPLSQVSWAYTKDVAAKMNQYPYDVEKAKKMLDDAGWKVGADGIREKNGKKLSFTWSTYVDSKYVEAMIPMLQADWKKIGVEVKANTMDFNALVTKVYTKREFDIYNMAWSMGVDPDDSYTTFHSTGDVADGNNSVGFRDPVNDNLLDSGRTEFDQAKRTKIYENWALQINDQCPYIFVDLRLGVDVVNNRVKNLQISPFEDFTYHIEKVELAQ